jgi:hypothetical protein
MCVQCKSGTTSNADAKQVIIGAANSKQILGWITFGSFNKLALAEDNANPTMATTFAADKRIEVALRVPVFEAILTTAQGTIYPGNRLVCAGNGYLGTHPDSLVSATTTAAATYYLAASALGIPLDPTVAICLSLVSTADSLQTIQVAPLW